MIELLWIALAGFGAQLVDGALGMGYGVTSASLLLATGVAPALAAASVNMAQVGTTLSSGLSHWRVGNVDWRIVRRLALPGGLGALAGATVLSSLSTTAARPVMAVLLLVLGVAIIARFVTRAAGGRQPAGAAWAARRRFLAPLGLVGGFVNATGGGGWGPVVTSTLLTTGPVPPRRVIGSVSTSEFVVTVCASVGFVLGLGLGGLHLGTILALMIGGVVAAPIAALLAGRLPAPVLGVAVGSLIVTLNLGPVLQVAGVGGGTSALLRAVALACCLLLLATALTRVRRARAAEPHGPQTPSAVVTGTVR